MPGAILSCLAKSAGKPAVTTYSQGRLDAFVANGTLAGWPVDTDLWNHIQVGNENSLPGMDNFTINILFFFFFSPMCPQ